MIQRLYLNSLIYLALVSLSLVGPVTVWGNCLDLLTVQAVSSKEYNPIDQALDQAALLETRLNEAMAQARDAKLGESLGQLALEVNELIDKLLEGGPHALALSERLDELAAQVDLLEAQPTDAAGNDTPESGDDEGGLVEPDQISLDRPLIVYDSQNRPFTVMFTSELIKDFTGRRVSPLVRGRLWHALNNGLITEGKNRAGIKVMRTWDGVPFVEVKSLKSAASNFRMFGCIKGDQITMHFIGYDMTSVSDPQRSRLKRLCQ